MQMHFPLFVRAKDCGENAKFNSVYDLQLQVEKIDIENEEYEAWDKDGFPVEMKLQEPVWIKLEPSIENHDPDQLRCALDEFAKSVAVQLPAQLPISEFETALGQVMAAQEKAKLAGSPVRRFFARPKQPPTS
jgi:hypothetical protein